MEPPSNPNQFSLTPISQAEGLTEVQNPPESATPDSDGLAAKLNHGQGVKPITSGPVPRPSDPNGAPAATEKSVSTPPASKPTQDPNVDARLAEQDDAFAQYRLGRYYAQRDGRQTPEAVRWYKKASPGLHRLAETGNGQAMYVLGVMYAYGRGVPRDTEQARRWLIQAVEQKVIAAKPVLANLTGTHHADPKPQVNDQSQNAKQQN